MEMVYQAGYEIFADVAARLPVFCRWRADRERLRDPRCVG